MQGSICAYLLSLIFWIFSADALFAVSVGRRDNVSKNPIRPFPSFDSPLRCPKDFTPGCCIDPQAKSQRKNLDNCIEVFFSGPFRNPFQDCKMLGLNLYVCCSSFVTHEGKTKGTDCWDPLEGNPQQELQQKKPGTGEMQPLVPNPLLNPMEIFKENKGINKEDTFMNSDVLDPLGDDQP